MSRRFAITTFIVMSSILIIFFLYVLILFLLPGVSLLGIKYIALNTHSLDSKKLIISDMKDSNGNKIGTYSGIILNTYEVPVEVIITGDYTYYLEYVDNYNGITTSKIKDPTVSFSKDSDGNAVISVSEYHTFLYESGTSERYFRLYMPLSKMNNEPLNLEINSTRSVVTFKMDSKGYIQPARYNKLKIKTNSDIIYNYNVVANTFIYETSQSIEIDETLETTVKATNYELTSTSGKVVVKTPVSGNLTCNTKLGKVLLHSCGNLTASTTFGDVGYSGDDDGKVKVNGVVDISTKAGNVTLGEVLGQSRQNTIKTTSGCINVIKIFDGTISTQRGQVNINSVRNFEVTSTTGQINIQEAKTKLKVTSTRGRINLGGDNMLMNNIDVDSTLGNVKVKSATGTVNINTVSADVEFVNLESMDIDISCGGRLSAENLKGNVKIYVSDAVESMTFESVNEGNTDITLGEKCSEAFVIINAQELEEVNYYVTGKTIEIKEYKDFNWQEYSGVRQDVFEQPSSNSAYHFTLNSNAQIAKITLGYYLNGK